MECTTHCLKLILCCDICLILFCLFVLLVPQENGTSSGSAIRQGWTDIYSSVYVMLYYNYYHYCVKMTSCFPLEMKLMTLQSLPGVTSTLNPLPSHLHSRILDRADPLCSLTPTATSPLVKSLLVVAVTTSPSSLHLS